MSPEQRAKRLLIIRDEIDSVWRLVECGCMAAQQLSDPEKDAIGELLKTVQFRLTDASAKLDNEVAADKAAT